jgi:phenylpyruvate tautomerase PptA (4-oxalocrotonate tautomerase family)
MPFVQIHVARETAPEARSRLGLALANAYAEHMRTSHRIVNVGFVRYDAGALARYDAAGDQPQEMTVVTCDVRAGRAPEMLEALGRAITSACARELGVPEARVAVYLTEHEAYQIYRDGGRAPDWSPAEASGPHS